MKKLLVPCFLLSSIIAEAQVTSPFTTCPTVVAIARPGTNTYAADPINFYNINNTTGAATIIPGGPLKNPANPANNMDLNGVGLNSVDGFLYGMGANSTTSQKFYRAGKNYSVQQVGTIQPPPVSGFFDLGIVNPAGGELDASNNYYFTAVSGTGFPIPTPTFFPSAFYIGKISNVSTLPAGTANITPVYTTLDFSNAVCSPYYLTLISAISQTTAQNTGLRDLVFNPQDGKLYTYVSFEFPSGSGLFLGELLSVDPATGVVNCYPALPLPFASATNEVAGTAMTSTGAIQILFTNGDIYRTTFSSPNVYSGLIVPLGSTGITGGLRGDLAACATASGIVPVKFAGIGAAENNCMVNLYWNISSEENAARYDAEQLDNTGRFVSVMHLPAANDGLAHSYHTSLPVNSKTMIFRIRETDLDGSITYSDAVTVNTSCEKTKSIMVINNIAVDNTLQVRWNNISTSENFTVDIYNSTGALVQRKAVQVTGISMLSDIDVSKLAPGIYRVSARSASGDKLTDKFIKK